MNRYYIPMMMREMHMPGMCPIRHAMRCSLSRIPD